MDSKKLSILILTYHNEKEIQACMDAVLLNIPKNYEVIVLDNQSQDATRSLLNENYAGHPCVRIYFNDQNIGFARGINQLAQHATGEYLLVLNPDTVAPLSEVQKMLDYLEQHPEVGIVGPKIVDEFGTVQESFGEALTPYNEFIGKVLRSKYAEKIPLVKLANARTLTKTGVVDVGWIGGACFLVKRDLFIQLHGLDTHFFLSHGDLVDFGMRVAKLGLAIRLYSDAVIIHTGSKSVAHDRDRALYEAYDGTLYFFKKHYTNRIVFLVKVVYVVTSFIKAFIAGIVSLVRLHPYREIALAHGKNAWRILTGELS